jgi:2-phospho-L-lactate guanylyltransferase
VIAGSSVLAVPSSIPSIGLLGQRAVLVPVKSFTEAKQRLGEAMGEEQRATLVRRMAARVLQAAAPLPFAVVCDDTDVADWARRHGALVIWEPGRGLNGAVQDGVERLAAMGVGYVTVAHGDLPHASGLGTLPAFEGVTLQPDRHGNGTNVIRVPTGCGFHFSYGPGSFARHLAECRRLDLPTRVLDVPALALDVDSPADLEWT